MGAAGRLANCQRADSPECRGDAEAEERRAGGGIRAYLGCAVGAGSAGSTGYGGHQILARIDTSVARDRIDVAGYLDDEALTSLYSRASVFAFPTLDEGFGMPALDAMACGVPVLASNRSAVPEVCGDAALLVNPDSTDELAEALGRLMRTTTYGRL